MLGSSADRSDTAGRYPIANYRVYQVGSTGSTLVGSPTSTTFNLSGPAIGSTYTYEVVAVDSNGGTSPPSAPVTFTVPPPGSTGGGGCAVHYTVTNSWPGGFGAGVTITNTGTSSINGWKLSLTLPSGESVQSGRNGTYSQTGQNVTVSNASWNGTIAPGGNVGVGFNGAGSGQPTTPTSFALNGTLCTSD